MNTCNLAASREVWFKLPFLVVLTVHSLGKLKDVKDKLFHFNPIGLVRFDELSAFIHVWDLLLCYMVLQLWFIFPIE